MAEVHEHDDKLKELDYWRGSVIGVCRKCMLQPALLAGVVMAGAGGYGGASNGGTVGAGPKRRIRLKCFNSGHFLVC